MSTEQRVAVVTGGTASAPDFTRVRRTLETNLLGAWRCCAEGVPSMRACGYGRIVNLSSTMASLERTRTASSPAYRVSKTGLNMLTRTLAAELEGTGILVNAASPGYTRTDMSPDAKRSVHEGCRHACLARDASGHGTDRGTLP